MVQLFMKMCRRSFLVTLTILIIAAAGCGAEKKKPNIILISVDTLRADRMSLFGNERETTPFMDSLAKKYIYFTRAYSQATFTLPSHWSMMTGLLPSQHGIYQDANYYEKHAIPSEGLITIAQMLGPAYSRYAVVDGIYLSPEFGLDQGFQEYISDRNWIEKDKDRIWNIMRDFEEPYFLFLHTFHTHDWNLRPLTYEAVYRDPEQKAPEVAPRKLGWDVSRADIDFQLDTYDEALRRTDKFLEEILTPFLDQIEKGELVVIITSDHGQSFWEPREDYNPCVHGAVPYVEQCHVPLIITLPGGRRDNMVAAGLDLLPTILEIAGVDIPASGADLKGLSLLKDASDRIVVTEALQLGDRSGISIRSALTYIVNAGRIEVYAQSDTKETKNLLTTKERTEELTRTIPEQLREELKAFGYLN